ncbi:unnamed protein product [Vitrella brassicaformis CCMP3155]|uniref:Uncharacterized protein n=1 Tax=Vitrella brassicaformis (strain CCMP3155) TaxID=1169540 RepID=A0A0G4FSB8_VITBC|nr:unnamed protein product [Vitrella brassicaformis CCMP3155]|eukprot:CEM17596.1 unnamed protein product [Vitrella brassicaformis CCMP3155]
MSRHFDYQVTQMLLQQGGSSSLGCQNWVGMTPIHLKFNAPQLRANAGLLSGEFAEGSRVGRPPQHLDGSESGRKTILQIAGRRFFRSPESQSFLSRQIPSFSSCALSIEQATSPVQRDKVLQKKRPSIIDQLYLLSHLRKLDLSDAKRCALTKHHLSSSSMFAEEKAPLASFIAPILQCFLSLSILMQVILHCNATLQVDTCTRSRHVHAQVCA